MKKFIAWLIRFFQQFDFPDYCDKEEGYVRVGADWIPVAEYREKYCRPKPCDGAKRCPNAEDVTCPECEKIIDRGREPITAEECAAQGGSR